MFLDFLKKTFCRKKTPDKPKEKRKRGKHARSRRQIQSEVEDVLMSLKTNAEHLCDYPDSDNTSLYKCSISRWPGRQAMKILLSEHGLSCEREKPKPKVNGEYRDKILYVRKKRTK